MAHTNLHTCLLAHSLTQSRTSCYSSHTHSLTQSRTSCYFYPQCNMFLTCNGNGRCRGLDGSCICEDGFSGSYCNVSSIKESFTSACEEGRYGYDCQDLCEADTTCSGNGRLVYGRVCVSVSRSTPSFSRAREFVASSLASLSHCRAI